MVVADNIWPSKKTGIVPKTAIKIMAKRPIEMLVANFKSKIINLEKKKSR